MFRSTMFSAIMVLGALGAANAWGGIFNRFSSDMLANLGYGRTPYRHYPYGQVEAEEAYAEALEGNRIDDVIDEPAHCYSAPCANNGDCCRGLVCLETEDGGRCLPAFAGRKMGEICNRENQCDAGLICEEVPGEMHICRPPASGRKQYNEDCNASSECDISRGLCCIMQRRHRQKARKSCGYFKEPLVCIGPVATDQIREFVQHTAGEKRIGAYGLH